MYFKGDDDDWMRLVIGVYVVMQGSVEEILFSTAEFMLNSTVKVCVGTVR